MAGAVLFACCCGKRCRDLCVIECRRARAPLDHHELTTIGADVAVPETIPIDPRGAYIRMIYEGVGVIAQESFRAAVISGRESLRGERQSEQQQQAHL